MRVAVVESDSLCRQLMMIFLSGEKAVTAVDGYRNAEEALKRLGEFPPDLLLVDLNLSGMTGIELIRQVKRGWPGIHILVSSLFEDREAAGKALAAGAIGYFPVGNAAEVLRPALEAIGYVDARRAGIAP